MVVLVVAAALLVVLSAGLVAALLVLVLVQAVELVVVQALVVAELGEVPASGAGKGEMMSRIQSLSLVILEYTPGFLAWAQPIPQLTMPAR